MTRRFVLHSGQEPEDGFYPSSTRKSRLLSIFLGILTVLVSSNFAVQSAFGQFDSASVLGTVKDPSGASVPSATVILKDRSMTKVLQHHLPLIPASAQVIELGVPEFCTFEDLDCFEIHTLMRT